MRICYNNLDYDIKLLQSGRDNFTVVYGKQVKKKLNYGDAASELGAAIMHAAACDGILDNSDPRDSK